MAQFLATTSRGLFDTLVDELNALGFKRVEKVDGGVLFETNWSGCYRANLMLRTATRILLPILDFPAYQPEDLYNNVKKRHDFTKYIGLEGTFALDVKVRDSSFRDQRFVALKIKDAIADQFRDAFDGQRPDVDAKNPDLRVVVRVVKNQVSLAIDTSGESLAYRGYRHNAGVAPLREHLAAALVRLSGWQSDMPIVDPMCGSGTILIEAAMMARRISPGSLRKGFAFQRLRGFQADAWNEILEAEMSQEVVDPLPFKLYGFDIDRKVLKTARANAVSAGVDEDIEFRFGPVATLEPPAERGLLILNPPYGERIGVSEELKDVYRDFAFSLKTRFKGWTCWLLSGNEELTGALKLKSNFKKKLFNGPLECRYLRYEIR